MVCYIAIASITSQNKTEKKYSRNTLVFEYFSSTTNISTLFQSFSASPSYSECVQERWQASRPAVGEHKTHSVLAAARAGHAKPHPLGCQFKHAARALREMAANERRWSGANLREATKKSGGNEGGESKMEGEHRKKNKTTGKKKNLGPKPPAFL